MENQKHLFELPEDITYLNGSYMSPQLRSVTKIGTENLVKKANPTLILEADFFSEKQRLKERFAQLIETDDRQTIAIIPSVSYGIATAMHNIPFEKGDEILVLEAQFPSNYYAWKQLETTRGVIVKTIVAPPIGPDRGRIWNESILEAINEHTKCLALPQVHWADGTLFDLKRFGERAREIGAYLIVDATQSVGAMPFSVKDIQPDAVICAGYKWLLGPYSLGVAYYGERFHHGTPIEDNWMNHQNSENFSNLVNYNVQFKEKASRYDVGESSNFILTPMLSEAIRQLIDWTPEAIQAYCRTISEESIQKLQKAGYFIEESEYRAKHLFGIYLPKDKSIDTLKEKLLAAKIFVSYRGKAIRISANVYNTKEDLEKLVKHLC